MYSWNTKRPLKLFCPSHMNLMLIPSATSKGLHLRAGLSEPSLFVPTKYGS